MPASPHHGQVCTNGSPTPGKHQDYGMDKQKKDGLGDVSFHFQKNEKMVQKWPATAGALKGEWAQLNQISCECCAKFCSAPLQFLADTLSSSGSLLRLWSQTLTFQELPIKHQGASRWEDHRRSTASQNFLTNWGESFSEHGWGLKAGTAPVTFLTGSWHDFASRWICPCWNQPNHGFHLFWSPFPPSQWKKNKILL